MAAEGNTRDIVIVPKRLKFLDKEFTENNISMKLLTDLMMKEEKRKSVLESRLHELTQVTKVDIREDIEKLAESVNTCLKNAALLRTQLGKTVQGNLPNRCDHPEIYVRLENIDYLEKAREYILVMHFVMIVSSKLSSHLRDKSYTEAITMFNQLRFLHDTVLSKSSAVDLCTYCSEVINTWETELYERVATELDKWLDKIGWPSKIATANPSDETIKKFQATIRSFITLTKGSTKATELLPKPQTLAEYRELSAVVQLLIKPIRKRFRYHFYSSKATSDAAKPEWYFAQVNQWMHSLLPFLSNHFEFIQQEVAGTSTIIEFVIGLSKLVVLKTDSVLTSATVPIDDNIFSKILEESSRLESEMLLVLDEYQLKDKEELPGLVNTIFSQASILNRWLSIEKRGSLEKLDVLFSSTSAWNRVVVPGPTEIAELFVMMVRFMVDRCSHLRQPGQKLQFVQLIMEILDDFRLRCLQVWKSQAAVDLEFVVAETLGYVHETLKEWDESPFFSTLDFFWDTIRTVEKEDLEARSTTRRLSDFTSQSDDTGSVKNGIFSQVCERYASSMEMLLISISQK